MSSLFMLDTDISSYIIKGNYPAIDEQVRSLDVNQICVSVITRAELLYGGRRLENATRLMEKIELFLSGIHTLPWDEKAADSFVDVRVDLERNGTAIGIMDTMIAAHCRCLGAVMVTNNTKHFAMVKGLSIQNWTQAAN